MTSINRRFAVLPFLAAGLLLFSGPCAAHAAVFPANDPEDEILKQIGVDEHPGAKLPAGTVFTDSAGKKVRLGDFFGGPPVILTLNYYGCPMLCPLTFKNLTDTFSRMGGLELGRDYRVVTVSFNPDETPELAAEKAAETFAMLPGGVPDGAWTFLVGDEKNIGAVTEAVGYRYAKVDQDYAHPSAIMVLTPGGAVSRYLYGISQEPMDLRLALIEAADGGIGKSRMLNRVLLYCFHYDPAGKKYSLAAMRIMTALGVVTLVVVGGLLLAMWVRERKGGRA